MRGRYYYASRGFASDVYDERRGELDRWRASRTSTR